MKSNLLIVLDLVLSFTSLASFQSQAAESSAATAQVLPGKGLARHDFLYAGESKQRRVFIIWKGQVPWSYDDPEGRGEISDHALVKVVNIKTGETKKRVSCARRQSERRSRAVLPRADRFARRSPARAHGYEKSLRVRRERQGNPVVPGPQSVGRHAADERENPDLGPATTIQILDEPDAPEKVIFGDIK